MYITYGTIDGKAILLMYEISDNKKIRDGHHYDTSDRFTLESKSSTARAAGAINTSASAGRILIEAQEKNIINCFRENYYL